ncbi:MAG TPA: helix-turn-helix domain-containing protein [Pseudonocardiaceae bacterium]|jgi:DNA-binding transcriptional ArsR family regulator|nr:helix-turn-helix domain-containing protein [Pseudonocardiaceae bacterium]
METIRLADVAAVLADPSRATMCLAMIDGRAWTVGELAKAAGIAPSTASEHVRRLADAAFTETVRQGRHHYVRLADQRVAELIERLAEHARHQPPRTLRSSLRARRLAYARTCYDHLAGRLGVALRDGMVRTGLVDNQTGLVLTPAGHDVLAQLGVPIPEHGRRPQLKECLDWTERREHLSGAVPTALLSHAVDKGWLDRDRDRSVKVHDSAVEPLALLGVDLTTFAKADEPV